MTIGTLKFRLTKMFPGVDIDVIEGFIADRYSEILHELPWSRLEKTTILQTTAPYTAGTVALTNGSAAVTLTSGTWTSGMTSFAFRVAGRDEIYTFTYVSGTTGTLDRAYEGSGVTAAGYSIFQYVYRMPADCRQLDDGAFSEFTLGPLAMLSFGELQRAFPSFPATGSPRIWAPYMDDSSSPPRVQVALYPVPDTSIGIPLTYTSEGTTPTASSAITAVWMEPASALVEGVMGKICGCPLVKDYGGATFHATNAAMALKTMRNAESNRIGPAKMELPDHYTSHRARRCR